jgi:hypothetical protein
MAVGLVQQYKATKEKRGEIKNPAPPNSKGGA